MKQKNVENKVPIYKLNTTEDIMKYYDEWGNKYDQDMVDWNYTAPKETVNAFKKYAPNKDITIFLWVLKVGALINAAYLWNSFGIASSVHLIIPAQVFFLISIFRCLFPVSYPRSTVFHNSIFSSVFLTRLLATFSEIAMIYQLSFLMRLLNTKEVILIDTLSWIMVIQVIISQFFVWSAIIFQRSIWYFYEEVGWFIIYAINTVVSIYIYFTFLDFDGRELLLYLNIIFGLGYIPWQFFHLKGLLRVGKRHELERSPITGMSWRLFNIGINNSIIKKHHSNRSDDWGGVIGITWMFGYWAVIMPAWLYTIIKIG